MYHQLCSAAPPSARQFGDAVPHVWPSQEWLHVLLGPATDAPIADPLGANSGRVCIIKINRGVFPGFRLFRNIVLPCAARRNSFTCVRPVVLGFLLSTSTTRTSEHDALRAQSISSITQHSSGRRTVGVFSVHGAPTQD
jgi:hypothetical protein